MVELDLVFFQPTPEEGGGGIEGGNQGNACFREKVLLQFSINQNFDDKSTEIDLDMKRHVNPPDSPLAYTR